MLDKTRLQHFRNLISLAAADGKLDEAEKMALSKIAFERGIPLDRLNVMLTHASEYQYLIPQNKVDRGTQLTEMIDIALVDGEFSQAEYELILSVSERLGFGQNEAEELISAHRARKSHE